MSLSPEYIKKYQLNLHLELGRAYTNSSSNSKQKYNLIRDKINLSCQELSAQDITTIFLKPEAHQETSILMELVNKLVSPYRSHNPPELEEIFYTVWEKISGLDDAQKTFFFSLHKLYNKQTTGHQVSNAQQEAIMCLLPTLKGLNYSNLFDSDLIIKFAHLNVNIISPINWIQSITLQNPKNAALFYIYTTLNDNAISISTDIYRALVLASRTLALQGIKNSYFTTPDIVSLLEHHSGRASIGIEKAHFVDFLKELKSHCVANLPAEDATKVQDCINTMLLPQVTKNKNALDLVESVAASLFEKATKNSGVLWKLISENKLAFSLTPEHLSLLLQGTNVLDSVLFEIIKTLPFTQDFSEHLHCLCWPSNIHQEIADYLGSLKQKSTLEHTIVCPQLTSNREKHKV